METKRSKTARQQVIANQQQLQSVLKGKQDIETQFVYKTKYTYRNTTTTEPVSPPRTGTALHAACLEDNITAVQQLLHAGANVNARDSVGLTPLSQCKSYEVVKLLLDAGADVHTTSDNGSSPFLALVHRADPSAVQLMLQAGPDIHARNINNTMPLHIACQSNKADVVQLLLQAGADVNAKNKWNVTPLHWACEVNKADVVQLLLAAGADTKATDVDGETLEDWIRDNEDAHRIKALLLQVCCHPPQSNAA